MPILTKIKSSIFLKLVLILIGFVILVNGLAAFLIYFTLDRNPQSMVNRYPVLLSKYIIEDIGMPPDTNKAKQLANDLNMNIRYELNNFRWTTDPTIAPAQEILNSSSYDSSKTYTYYNYRLYAVKKLPNGFVTVAPWLPRDFINLPKAIISVIAFITIVIVVLYFVLRWLFSPVKILSKGVEDISKGQLDYKINVETKDELGKLAILINNMTENISRSIKAKETLLVDVSHELRTPLTRMKLSSEFIDDEKIKTKIKDDVNEMEHMVGELLDNYKKGNALSKPEISGFDLNALIQSSADKILNDRIIFKKQNKPFIVKADKEKIETVIKNLIDNALKYSKEEVLVNAVSNPDNTDGFILTVADKGIGIPKEELSFIFEPFYRVDKSRNKAIMGYGLGLNIVKKIIELHNGTIEVKSEKGLGTEFTVKI